MKNLNSTQKWLLALLPIIIVFLILAVVLVYLNWQETVNNEDVGNASNPSGYQIPMGITLPDEKTDSATNNDPTAGWLEFKLTNKTSATGTTSTLFSFKYPSVFEIRESKNHLTLESNSVTSTQLDIDYKKSNKDLLKYLKELDEINATGYEGKPSIKVVTSTDQVTVAGVPAIFREQKLLAADLSQYVVYFKITDTIYSISLNAPILDQNLFALFALFVNSFIVSQ